MPLSHPLTSILNQKPVAVDGNNDPVLSLVVAETASSVMRPQQPLGHQAMSTSVKIHMYFCGTNVYVQYCRPLMYKKTIAMCGMRQACPH